MMEETFARYWIFGIACLGYATLVVWLLFHRRLSLQSSLAYLCLVVGLGVASLLLAWNPRLVGALGFELPSNFVFAASIGALSLLHLMALMTVSKVEARSVTLVQELALLQEELSRVRAAVGDSAATSAERPSPQPPAPVATSGHPRS
jgi:hypothetical protein